MIREALTYVQINFIINGARFEACPNAKFISLETNRLVHKVSLRGTNAGLCAA